MAALYSIEYLLPRGGRHNGMADFEVIFVDVGQGDCTLVRLSDGEYMLVDVYRCPDHGIDVLSSWTTCCPTTAMDASA